MNNKKKPFWGIVLYALNTILKFSSLLIIALVLIYGIYYFFYDDIKIANHPDWDNYFNPLLAILGTAAPVIVWIYFLDREWKEKLDHKLIIHFFTQDYDSKKYLMSGYNCHILPNADIRVLGQQIGSQIADGDRNLLFASPSIEPVSEGVIRIRNKSGINQWIRYTEIEIGLKDLPGCMQTGGAQYRIWKFDKDIKHTITYSRYFEEPLHISNISIEEVLSTDSRAIENFLTMDEGS